ncbi:hypothetical protein CLOP_g14532 [Closterium sp. NIES-67]|nr:hypothetical protein CLOP_g14532 [Closterium sp. NIES-67]
MLVIVLVEKGWVGLVRMVVQILMERGKQVDLDAVIDEVMNEGGGGGGGAGWGGGGGGGRVVRGERWVGVMR